VIKKKKERKRIAGRERERERGGERERERESARERSLCSQYNLLNSL